MQTLRHCIIDLETLDLIPSSKIVSIGAVIFDPRVGKIGETLYIELDHKAQNKRTTDKSVIKWWKEQPPEIRKALKGKVSLEDALEDLSFFLPKDCKVWGNGATFDISMLEDAYRQYDMEIPWKFWNIRDCRTIRDLYESARGGYNKAMGANKHNALDDAIFEAKMVCFMWNKILNPR